MAPLHSGPRPAPTRKLKSGCLIGLAVLVTLAGITICIVFYLWRATPRYWAENQEYLHGLSSNARRDLADSIQNHLITEYGTWLPRPPLSDGSMNINARNERVRTMRISYQDINLWIDERKDGWLANQNVKLPREIKKVMIADHKGKPVIAFHYQSSDQDLVVSIILCIRLLPTGKAVVGIDGARGGQLPIPASAVTNIALAYLAEAEETEIVRYLSVILNGEEFDPLLPPADVSHHMRLIGLRSMKDGLVLTIRAEPRVDQADAD